MWIAKKTPIKSTLLFLLFSSVGIALFVFSQEMGQGVRYGISLCGELVIPALFVFLCFCEWACLSGTFQRVSVVFNPLFHLLFGKNFRGSVPLLLCLVGGYPMGASALSVAKKTANLSDKSINKLALWIFCPSPSFVIIGVGQGMLNSFQAGIVLWLGCVLSCLLTGCVICRVTFGNQTQTASQIYREEPLSNALAIAVDSATRKMLAICGTVILVGGIASVVSVLPFLSTVQTIFRLFLEVTNGCSYLAEKGGSLAEFGAVLMFGGIGTHLQCRMLLGNDAPTYKTYFLVRVIQTVLCYGMITLFGLWFPNTVQTLSNGGAPAIGTVSVLPSVGLLATCCVFLCSMNENPFIRRKYSEKSGIYS